MNKVDLVVLRDYLRGKAVENMREHGSEPNDIDYYLDMSIELHLSGREINTLVNMLRIRLDDITLDSENLEDNAER